MTSEAHLAAAQRSTGLVLWLRSGGRKRSPWGWIVFFGLIVLNETRGLYMAIEIFKVWRGG